MKLDDIIFDLKCGELSSHGIFVDLNQDNKDRLISCINSGLLALYTRFPLLTKELVLKQRSDTTLYKLKSIYAFTDKTVGVAKYIVDTPKDPFKDDVIRIELVQDECNNLLLNNTSECKVALTPAMDAIEIPNPYEGNYLFVVYQAKHPKVDEVNDAIELPEHLKQALLAYVAHRIYSGSTAQDAMAISQSLYQKYELLCAQYVDTGMTNQDDNEYSQQFDKGGWI